MTQTSHLTGHAQKSVSPLLRIKSTSKESISSSKSSSANILSDYTNVSIPDPSIYVETGVDAFVYEDDNMFAEDDFDEDMLSFEVDLSLMNGLTEMASSP